MKGLKIGLMCAGGALAACLVAGCEKDGIDRYDAGDSVVYFSKNNFTHSFAETPGVETADVTLDVTLVGPAVGYDREIAFEVVPDETTATAGQYEILSGAVPANGTSGAITVRVKYDREALAEGNLSLKLQLKDNAHFSLNVDEQSGPFNSNKSMVQATTLIWTDQLPMPEYWLKKNFYKYLTYTPIYADDEGNVYGEQNEAGTRKRLSTKYNGVYSQKMGEILREIWPEKVNALGYLGTDAETIEKYPLVIPGQAYFGVLLHKLETYVYEYNRTHPGEPLRHSDDCAIYNAAGNITSVKSGGKTYILKFKENPPILVNPYNQ